MKSEIYWKGVPGSAWSIWDKTVHLWVGTICEETPMLATARLYQMLGEKAKDPRYEPRMTPSARRNQSANQHLGTR